jgi:hypothetical protein
MATNHQITCISKTNRLDPHERIHSVGGRNGDGTTWKLTEQDAIAAIEQGRWNFWVIAQGRSVWVIVATHSGHKYLKTEADNFRPDNLLSLPECP